jgi:hypothetical protein
VVEQATGVMMALGRLDTGQARLALSEVSRRTGLALGRIAELLTAWASTDAGANPGFGLTRSLIRLGHTVIAADANRLTPGFLLLIASRRARVIPSCTQDTVRAFTGSSLNSAVEVNAVSGGDRVDEGLELGGWVRVGPCLPPSVEGDGGGEPGTDGS